MTPIKLKGKNCNGTIFIDEQSKRIVKIEGKIPRWLLAKIEHELKKGNLNLEKLFLL